MPRDGYRDLFALGRSIWLSIFLWQATDLPKHTTPTGKAFIYASSFVFTASWFYGIARLVSEMAREANF